MTELGHDPERVEVVLDHDVLVTIDERAENASRTREQMLELLISIGLSASTPPPTG